MNSAQKQDTRQGLVSEHHSMTQGPVLMVGPWRYAWQLGKWQVGT